MLVVGFWASFLLPRCGQAKEPSNTKNSRPQLKVQQTLVPPTVRHHAHSCQHFGFRLASWVFLKVRKQCWSPTLRFCPKPILALADTVQNEARKQISRLEAFCEVPATSFRAVQQWWQLRQPLCDASPKAVRRRWGCQASGKENGSIHLSCFQGSLWKAAASHPQLHHSWPLGTKQPHGWQQEWRWIEKQLFLLWLLIWWEGRRKGTKNWDMYIFNHPRITAKRSLGISPIKCGECPNYVRKICIYCHSFLSMSLLVQIPSPAIQIMEVIFLTLVTGIGLQTHIFYCYALKGCQQKGTFKMPMVGI